MIGAKDGRLKRFLHHVNGDTLDNRPENLALLVINDHSKLHCAFPNAPRRELRDGRVVTADAS